MSNFVFGTMNSATYDVALFEVNTESAAAQEYDRQSIPGKSGDFLLRMNRFPNVEHVYAGIVYTDYASNISAFKGALLSQNGYQRLEDSFHTDEFYLASYQEVLEIEKSKDGSIGRFEIVFDRKPQRFLKSGETVTTLTASGTINNPTQFDAKPLLRVYGAGTVGIAGNSILITSADTYTDIDCEIMEAYKGTLSRNGSVQVQGYDFPVLHPGSNGITLGSGITRVEITPRWWRL